MLITIVEPSKFTVATHFHCFENRFALCSSIHSIPLPIANFLVLPFFRTKFRTALLVQ